MKADSIAEGWDSETLKSVREILEAASIRHLDVIIELFFPAGYAGVAVLSHWFSCDHRVCARPAGVGSAYPSL
jgi:hypothetical protein